jgi:cyclophilin family peptidyl-prolyl cis-trans isomerase
MRAFLAIIGLMVAAACIAIAVAFLRPNSSSIPTEEAPKANEPAKPPQKLMDPQDAVKGALKADLEIEGRGNIVLEVYPAAAPKTVAHFEELCKQHFYDGMLVHRVESDPAFKLFQTGDPTSKRFKPENLRGKSTDEVSSELHLGMTGSGKTVPLEAHLPNAANSLGLARSQDEDSGDSQFYINLTDNRSLDGRYCVFGRMLSGRAVAEKVQIGDRIKKLSMEPH